MQALMLSGAINNLIWILVLIAIIAVVIAVVRAVMSPRDAAVVERPVVEQPVARQAAPVASGLAPGWYPDQNDPSLMRYYDGRVWTAQTQPHA
ncbi:hypothetical protein A9X00_25375 [Mycobacterium sp. 1245805.9]|nr:hypothetical protein A9X00_25375 [Mycobacterium sp. 1245805.9]